jgi:hypothetical protein
MKKTALLKNIDETIAQLQAAKKKIEKLPDLINSQMTIDEGGYTDPQGCGSFSFTVNVVNNKNEPPFVDVVLEYNPDDDHVPEDLEEDDEE